MRSVMCQLNEYKKKLDQARTQASVLNLRTKLEATKVKTLGTKLGTECLESRPERPDIKVSLLPEFKENNVIEFYEKFELVAKLYSWPREQWYR